MYLLTKILIAFVDLTDYLCHNFSKDNLFAFSQYFNFNTLKPLTFYAR